MLDGRSFFPTSVAGFIQAKRRNSGWRGTGSREPCSVRVIEVVGPCNKPATHSNVSALARLTSSSKILPPGSELREIRRNTKGTYQWPKRSAFTSGPSTNPKANFPLPWMCCISNVRTSRSKASQFASETFSPVFLRLRGASSSWSGRLPNQLVNQ